MTDKSGGEPRRYTVRAETTQTEAGPAFRFRDPITVPAGSTVSISGPLLLLTAAGGWEVGREVELEVTVSSVPASLPVAIPVPDSARLSSADRRRLRDGEGAMRLLKFEPASRADAEAVCRELLDGARALQSLDNLGSREANDRAWECVLKLSSRGKEVQRRLDAGQYPVDE